MNKLLSLFPIFVFLAGRTTEPNRIETGRTTVGTELNWPPLASLKDGDGYSEKRDDR